MPEMQRSDGTGGTVLPMPRLREDELRHMDAAASRYLGYCLSDGAVVHKKCRAKYQRGFSSIDTDHFPRTVTAIERGDLHASMYCSHCSQPLDRGTSCQTSAPV